MICPHQGTCGGCALALPYEEQWKLKESEFRELLPLSKDTPTDLHPSAPHSFRARAEFRLYRNESGRLSYAMSQKGSKQPLPIQSCPILLPSIQALMPSLLEALESDEILTQKLFGVEFLSGLSQEVLASLLYHKRLDHAWEERALGLLSSLPTLSSLIGRSKGQKIVLGESFITETLTIDSKPWRFLHYEGSFTQPNPKVNEKMIEWIISAPPQGDLLELYCGAGNFTLPLSSRYAKILATEVSKTSIHAAKQNCELNSVRHISFVRLNAQETQSALEGEREFYRLRELDLPSYDFQTVFVDPPRAGLGAEVASFLRRFDQILYISCNPKTLQSDLEVLQLNHDVERFALFDQFPYTPHLESGVILRQRR